MNETKQYSHKHIELFSLQIPIRMFNFYFSMSAKTNNLFHCSNGACISTTEFGGNFNISCSDLLPSDVVHLQLSTTAHLSSISLKTREKKERANRKGRCVR